MSKLGTWSAKADLSNDAAVVAELNAVSLCEPESHAFDFRDRTLGFDVTLPPLLVATVTFRFAAPDGG